MTRNDMERTGHRLSSNSQPFSLSNFRPFSEFTALKTEPRIGRLKKKAESVKVLPL